MVFWKPASVENRSLGHPGTFWGLFSIGSLTALAYYSPPRHSVVAERLFAKLNIVLFSSTSLIKAAGSLYGLWTLGKKKINSKYISERSWPFPLTTFLAPLAALLCACHCSSLHQSLKTSFSSCLTYWYYPTTDKTQSNVIWAGDGIICNAQKSLLMFNTGAILNTLLSLTGIFITPLPCRWRI